MILVGRLALIQCVCVCRHHDNVNKTKTETPNFLTMKTRNQLEHGYPKLLRIEPENESSKLKNFFQESPYSGSALHRNPVVNTERINPRGVVQQPDVRPSLGNAAPMSSGQHSTNSGYVSYNYGHQQNTAYVSYPVYPGRKSTKPNSNTGGTSNIYLGGRTSSFGPSGYNAVQKQYSFGRYSAGTSTSEGSKETK